MSDVTRYAFDMAACWHEHPDGEFVEHDAYAKLEAEARALRQQVADRSILVVPERMVKTEQSSDEYDMCADHWNACLDELARLNGKTVSEGLLRLTLEFIMATNYKGSIPLGLIEELRALLNQDKENGNG